MASELLGRTCLIVTGINSSRLVARFKSGRGVAALLADTCSVGGVLWLTTVPGGHSHIAHGATVPFLLENPAIMRSCIPKVRVLQFFFALHTNGACLCFVCPACHMRLSCSFPSAPANQRYLSYSLFSALHHAGQSRQSTPWYDTTLLTVVCFTSIQACRVHTTVGPRCL